MLAMLCGWLQGEQEHVIAFLREENRVLKAQLGQLSTLHAASVVHDGQRRVGGVAQETDARRAGVQGVGNDFSEDRFLERTSVGIPQIFEEMLEVDPSLAHAGYFSAARSTRLEAVDAAAAAMNPPTQAARD